MEAILNPTLLVFLIQRGYRYISVTTKRNLGKLQMILTPIPGKRVMQKVSSVDSKIVDIYDKPFTYAHSRNDNFILNIPSHEMRLFEDEQLKCTIPVKRKLSA